MQVFHMKEAPLSLLDIFSTCKERVSEEMFDNTRDTTTNTYRSKTYVVSTAPIEFNEESINDKANIEGHGSMLFFFFSFFFYPYIRAHGDKLLLLEIGNDGSSLFREGI